MKGQKGIAIVWMQCLITIFIISFAYIFFSYVIYGELTPVIYPKLAALDPVTSGVNTTAMQNTINMINIMWMLWPIILILAVLLYGIMASQKKGYEVSYQ